MSVVLYNLTLCNLLCKPWLVSWGELSGFSFVERIVPRRSIFQVTEAKCFRESKLLGCQCFYVHFDISSFVSQALVLKQTEISFTNGNVALSLMFWLSRWNCLEPPGTQSVFRVHELSSLGISCLCRFGWFVLVFLILCHLQALSVVSHPCCPSACL